MPKQNIAHPNIISESGRAVVSYYSVLVFNILDVTSVQSSDDEPATPENPHDQLKNLIEVNRVLCKKICRSA